MVIIIGISGMIASGKSTVAKCFRDLKYPVFDADGEVRRLYQFDREIMQKVSQFAPNAYKGDCIDKKILSKMIENDVEILEKLSEIVHPIVRKKMIFFIKKNIRKKILMLDIPLLFEAGLDKICNHIIYVKSNVSLIDKRLKMRNQPSAQTLQDAQVSQIYKIKNSDFIINNNLCRNHIHKEIVKILHRLRNKILSHAKAGAKSILQEPRR